MTTKANDLKALVIGFRANTLNGEQHAQLAEQLGRLISSRLRTVWPRWGPGAAWHDMHQECWSCVTLWLNGNLPFTKPSTQVYKIVDLVVEREQQGQTRNSWSCMMDAVTAHVDVLEGRAVWKQEDGGADE
jgi:hypothetical protein